MRDETLVPGVELLESMRSVGYSFNAAAADIIDNSIAAAATAIDIYADTVDGRYVCYFDDGTGMSPDEARDALKLAGTRGIERGSSDLGRFGLGLKTASLSQGRNLTVVTKRDGEITGLQWDLDHVLRSGNWAIRVLDQTDLDLVPHYDLIREADHGTLVIWESLDYLLAGARDISTWISRLLSDLRAHLGLVFHWFLEGRGGVAIRINGLAVRPVDPFLQHNPKTQVAPVENVSIDGHNVVVAAFTLPHVSGMTAKDRMRDDLGTNMRDYQGFYVYRNRRLISAGGWFGLAKQDELSKQTRVRVEIPPALDHHWQLDIKKSRVEPPQAFRQRFRQIIDQVKIPSTRVHRFRGRNYAVDTEITALWTVVEDRDGFRYDVNPDHPSVAAIRAMLSHESRPAFDGLLEDIAGTFPTSDVYVRIADNKQQVTPQRSADDVLVRLRAMRDGGASQADPDTMSAALAKIEPFNAVPDLRRLVNEVWKETHETQQ